MQDLVRVEIIYSQALDEDFVAAFKEAGVAKRFTKLNNVMGAGCSTPRMGDNVWPQLNMMYLIFCSSDEAAQIQSIVNRIRGQYSTEGVACFISSAKEG